MNKSDFWSGPGSPPPPYLKTVLTVAKEQVKTPDQWCQHQTCDDRDRVCFIGAIFRAVEIIDDLRPLKVHWDLIARGIGIPSIGYGEGAKWNDAPERTHQDILAAFDRCIALTEE